MSDNADFALIERRLQKNLGRALSDFSMIEEGDKIMVCVSGGKDSYTLLHLLRGLARRAPVHFELKVVNLDQGQPGYEGHILRDYMAREGYDFTMVEENTYAIVKEKVPEGNTYCSLCSRLRRGVLYRVASELGCTKIALGHHRDDILQTLLLNIFFSGKIGAMPPKLRSDDGKHVLIRPLAYCAEDDIRAYAKALEFPILPCDLCGSQEQLQRKVVGKMIDDLEEKHPGLKQTMLASTMNVRASQLLDRDLWAKLGIHVGTAKGGDLATEAEEQRPGSSNPHARKLPLLGSEPR